MLLYLDAYLLTDLRHLVQESLKQGRALQRVQEQLRAQSALLKSMDDQTNYNSGHDNSTRPSHGGMLHMHSILLNFFCTSFNQISSVSFFMCYFILGDI